MESDLSLNRLPTTVKNDTVLKCVQLYRELVHPRVQRIPSGGVLLTIIFLIINVFYEPHMIWDPIASRGGSVPVFLRRAIVSCDFQGSPDHLLPSGFAHVVRGLHLHIFDFFLCANCDGSNLPRLSSKTK